MHMIKKTHRAKSLSDTSGSEGSPGIGERLTLKMNRRKRRGADMETTDLL